MFLITFVLALAKSKKVNLAKTYFIQKLSITENELEVSYVSEIMWKYIEDFTLQVDFKLQVNEFKFH